ncbi:MAG: heptosyltransferase [Chthoniobacter sp.]|nr:heptosyltransferase [Chthoniobacter sp.]
MASAVLQPLRERYPDSHLVLCVGPWAAPLFEGHPAIDELIVVALPWWRKIRGDAATDLRTLSWPALIRQLRQDPFDLFLDLRSDLRHIALYGVLGGARHILAYARTGGAEVLSASVPYVPDEHEVRKNLRLLEPLGIRVAQPAISLPVSQADETALTEKLRAGGIRPEDSIVTLCPQTRLRVKDWPGEAWQALVEVLVRKWPRGKFVVVGDQGLDFAVTDPLRGSVAVFAGTLRLRELNALLARSRLVIGSDSAPLHLAAAHPVPILALFGPTRPELFAPFCPQLSIIQGVCRCNRDLHLDCIFRPGQSGQCMQEITVERVALSALHLLEPRDPEERLAASAHLGSEPVSLGDAPGNH